MTKCYMNLSVGAFAAAGAALTMCRAIASTLAGGGASGVQRRHADMHLLGVPIIVRVLVFRVPSCRL